MDIKESMRRILAAESAAVAAIPVTDEYERAVELIVEHVHRRRGKLITSGMGKADSPLAREADVALFTAPAPEVCPLGLTPTTSTTMMTVIGDVLVVNVMESITFDRADYARRHHGGYLGTAARGERS